MHGSHGNAAFYNNTDIPTSHVRGRQFDSATPHT
jgi:hypothetical protein